MKRFDCPTKKYIYAISLILFMLMQAKVSAQSDSAYTIQVKKKCIAYRYRYNMEKFATSGFYLQRNCVVDMVFADDKVLKGLIDNITRNEIWISNYVDEAVAVASHDTLKILHYKTDSIKELRLTANKVDDKYISINRFYYDFSSVSVNEPCALDTEYKTVKYGDTSSQKIFKYLTYYKLENIYEEGGKIYYYDKWMANHRVGRVHRKHLSTHYDLIAGSNMYDGTVTGLAAGYSPDAKRSLLIKGVNIDLFGDNIFWFIYLPKLMFNNRNPFRESDLKDLDHYRHSVRGRNKIKIKGLNISPGGDSGAIMIKGCSLAGVGQALYESNGVMVSGLFNRIYSFRGLNIAAFRNASSVGRGVQIGLSNYCKDFKGIQIGLWNRNGKRTMPFINWS